MDRLSWRWIFYVNVPVRRPAVMFGICEGPNRGWSSVAVLMTLILGAVLLAAAIVFEPRTAEPL
ncbi:hypothetical protein ACYF6T_40875 [Streptomyces sp. 7R007]